MGDHRQWWHWSSLQSGVKISLMISLQCLLCLLVKLKVDSLPRLSLFHLPPVFCWPSGLSAVVNAVSPSKSNVAERPCISYCTRFVFRGQ